MVVQEVNCKQCNDTGAVWVNYPQCEDMYCTAHQGYDPCEACNVRPIKLEEMQNEYK